jgi:hypothetical protein
LKSAFDKLSAMAAPAVEHRRIFCTSNLQPMAAATVAVAFTNVVHNTHLVLYPFFQIVTEPTLSTQTRTGRPLHQAAPAVTHKSGPTSSSAESFLESFSRLVHASRSLFSSPTEHTPTNLH